MVEPGGDDSDRDGGGGSGRGDVALVEVAKQYKHHIQV